MEAIEKVATAVLYEGYLLWPYRRSATKNQQRWTFGGVYPRAYSETCGSNDPWLMQTECLVVGTAPRTAVKVRFLHVIERQVGRQHASGFWEFVDELQVGDERYFTWDEAIECEILVPDLDLARLKTPKQFPIAIAADSKIEKLLAPDGSVAGALLRSWRSLEGVIEISAERLDAVIEKTVFRLRVRITNVTPWPGRDRERALKQTLVSTHTILTVTDGEFVSLTDPPLALEGLVPACQNIKTWPVLAGEEGDKHTMLSSPIILYDYPQVAPESAGDLFDGDDFMQLHGTIREFRRLDGRSDGDRSDGDLNIPTWYEELEKPVPKSVLVNDIEIRPGSKVRLRPRPSGDIMDLALDGKVAFIESIEQDYNDQIHLTVTLEDDPGRELGLVRQPGHRFFFAPEEVEPLER